MKKIFSICVLLIFMTGCSVFRPWKQEININSVPDNVSITMNGIEYETPVQVDVRRNHDLAIQAYKKGYIPYQRIIRSQLNTTGVLDIIGALFIAVPGVGLLAPGAYSLDETNINIFLYEEVNR